LSYSQGRALTALEGHRAPGDTYPFVAGSTKRKITFL
jgi:hypothetical protein